MTTRKALRREIRRRSIVEAAAAVFAEMGIEAATLEEIGERVGLSKASLYYYVKSKEALVADVLESVLDEIDARTARLTDRASSPVEQLRVRAFAHVETAFETPAGRLVIANLDTLVGNARAAELLRRHEAPARALLREAIAHGLLREIDVVCAVKLLYGALNNIPRWYRPEEGPLAAVIGRTWDIFVGGILVPAR